MSLLVIDVGNTNIELGVFAADRLVGSWRLETARDRTADEYGILARQLLSGVAHDFDGAIVASVVPPLHGVIDAMIEKYFGVDAIFVEPGIKTGLSIHTENPLEVGADRIVNAVAVHTLYGGPSVVVDFGTATTFDLVSANGEYQGGVIAPGLTISAEALFARAARLPRVEIRKPAQVIGTNTISSVQSGLYYGYLGLVDGILARIKSSTPPLKTVVATGSMAEMFAADSQHIVETDSELTLKGLKIIYDRNQGTKRGRRR